VTHLEISLKILSLKLTVVSKITKIQLIFVNMVVVVVKKWIKIISKRCLYS